MNLLLILWFYDIRATYGSTFSCGHGRSVLGVREAFSFLKATGLLNVQ